MSNLYSAMVITSKAEGMNLWSYELATVKKEKDGRFRVSKLVDGSILWVKPLHSGLFEIVKREQVCVPEKQTLKKDLHPCLAGRQHDYTDRLEEDGEGRVLLYCICGAHTVIYVTGHIHQKPKKASTTRDVIRNPEPERRTVFGAMVWNDWDRSSRVLMYLCQRPDGFFQAYIDQKGDVLQKFVVMRDLKSGDYIINHPHSQKEGKVKHLRPIQRTDYTD